MVFENFVILEENSISHNPLEIWDKFYFQKKLVVSSKFSKKRLCVSSQDDSMKPKILSSS